MGAVKSTDRNRHIIEEIQAGGTLEVVGKRYGISPARVWQICRAAGVKSTNTNFIGAAEGLEIAARIMRGHRITHIAEDIGRDPGVVRYWAIRKGIYIPSQEQTFWSEEEKQTLKREWGKRHTKEIGAMLGRSKNEVIGQARRMGLKKLDPGKWAAKYHQERAAA